MTMEVYMDGLLDAILHTIQDGKLLAQHPLTHKGVRRRCVYHCDDGYRCAIGCVLDSHHLKEVDAANLNGCGMMALVTGEIIAFPEKDGYSAARLLQNCHDRSLSGSTAYGLGASPPNWMEPYSHLCGWFHDHRGKASSLLMVQELVQAMQREDWGEKEAA